MFHQSPTFWQKRKGFVAGVLFAVVCIPAAVIAMPDELRIPMFKTHEKGDPPEAAVFSHWSHDQYYCYSCHPQIFPQKRQSMTHADFAKGKYCGTCHNGKIAWDIDDDNIECESCHREGRP
ncbi:MAG: cytochrome c3 family protein [Myxococcota bacterium]